MKRRKIAAIFVVAIIISMVSLLVPVPVKVFAYEEVIPEVYVPKKLLRFANLTLKLENFNFTYHIENASMRLFFGDVDIEIEAYSHGNSTIIRVYAEGYDVDVSFNSSNYAVEGRYDHVHLDVTVTIEQETANVKAEAEARIPVWKLVREMIKF